MKKKILSLVLILILILILAMFVLTGCGSDDEETTDSSDETSLSETEDSEETISTTESYIGYYADIDSDGIVDGVIYADLLIGGSGNWNNDSGSYYSYDAIESSKDYYIIQEDYEGDFGTADVLAPVSESTGNDRFYVMALEDLDSDSHYWYYDAFGNLDSDYDVPGDVNDFGEGKSNTDRMIEAWNNETYGSQNIESDHTDMWEIIQDEVNEGWFVPSKSEWAAFGDAFGIGSSDYGNYKLSAWYWASTQASSNIAFAAYFYNGYIAGTNVYNGIFVRLSTTF